MQSFAQAPASLLLEDRIRMYFSCRPPADSSGMYTSYTGFVDLDRDDPTRILGVAEHPVLPLGGSGEFDEFGVYPFSAICQGGRVLGYYGGWTRCESVPFNVAIGHAISEDGGSTFRRHGRGPVVSYSLNEPFVLSGPKIRHFGDCLHLFYIAGRKWKVVDARPEPVYRIRLARSRDGVHWSKLNRDLIPGRIEADEAQASPDVFQSGDRFHMFFCYRYSERYRSKEFGYRIGYAWSKNLEDWTRDDCLAGLKPSQEGWDSQMISYPHLFAIDGKIYMAYLGNDVGREGFGLAILNGNLPS